MERGYVLRSYYNEVKMKHKMYISSLEEENERLKTEIIKLHSQIDFINTLPQEQLNDLIALSLELENIKKQYENAIAAAKEAKRSYESAVKDIRKMKINVKIR